MSSRLVTLIRLGAIVYPIFFEERAASALVEQT